jgi:beta-galactosidase
MKIKNIFGFIGLIVPISLLIAGCSTNKSANAPDRDHLFNTGWKFIRDSVAGAEQPGFNDSEWIAVDLPHDYSIMDLPGEDGPDQTGPFSRKSPGNGNSTGQVPGGTGWYRKSFTISNPDEGKIAILKFDGVYMESEVWVNGKKAGTHKNGYTPFWFDITSLLNSAGKTNVIAVRVDNTGRNSRWYSGSGIYRNVHLTLTQPVHVVVWGVNITTPEINQNSAFVEIAVTTENEREKKVKANVIINIKDKADRLVATENEKIVLASKSDNITTKRIEVKDPLLWSVESPDLYSAEIIIKVGNKVTDKYNQTFGIRSLEFSAEKGFLLNGKSVELKGGCMHHDNGLLGSAAFDRAEERRVEIMKSNGFNAIRCAHNPPSTAFLDACDKLGMLVIDEFTDMWVVYKNPQDYSRFFREWWNEDLTGMIMRDRNHPSIIMWSIGNEIPGRTDTTGVRIGKQLAERIKSLDNSRAVTEAVCAFLTPGGWENTFTSFEILDIGGYNYEWAKYEPDHQKYPERIMYSSESFPLDAYDSWKPAEKLPYVIGDFVWTSMDYLGEVLIGNSTIVPEAQKSRSSGIPSDFKIPEGVNIFDLQVRRPSSWPAYVAWCGDIDITGEKKPQILYRDVIWDNSKIEINVHAPIPKGYAENVSMWGWADESPSWSWKGNEGKPLEVRVFTKASHVQLELNGMIIGEKDLTEDDKYIAIFKVPYQPGELKAIAIENGKEIEGKVLKTSGEAAGLRLIADRSTINADRNDLSFIKVEVVDKNDLVVPDAEVKVKLTITGNGELAATGNASPNDMESVNKPVIKTFKGKAQAILRPFSTGGNITLKAESEGLTTGELTITAK